MTTVIENGRPVERTVRIEKTTSDSSAGWAVAVIILLAVIAGGIYMWRHNRVVYTTPAPQGSGANINVTIPTGGSTSGSANDGTVAGSGAGY